MIDCFYCSFITKPKSTNVHVSNPEEQGKCRLIFSVLESGENSYSINK